MPEVELLATGEGEYRLHDPDAIRPWMRDQKRREFVEGLTVDEVIAEMGVKPRVAARVEQPVPPGARETEILRDHIDPGRTVIGRTGKR